MTSKSLILVGTLVALLAPGLCAQSGSASREELSAIDPGVPSQQLFAGWPPQALRARPYWLPWAYPSFQRATLFGRPVLFLLSVEWSHTGNRVMREVLTDPELLGRINEELIVVAADADRRPDLKERFLQRGWPGIHLLLPDGSPMISGVSGEVDQRTPIASGPIGLPQATMLVEEGARYWQLRPDELRQIAADWMGAQNVPEPAPVAVTLQTSDGFARLISGDANRRDGGFGVAPHFLRPSVMEYAAVADERGMSRLAAHGRLSLERLSASALFDDVEGGLHRMAANADWSGIEYEKLLSQQAALMRELAVAIRREESVELRQALRATARFVIERLGRPGGGFFNAQPASDGRVAPSAYWASGQRDESRRPAAQQLVLAGPTALAGAALLRAGTLLGEDEITKAGRAALDWVLANGWEPGRGFRHVLFPRPTERLFLTTQADVCFALVDAYQVEGEPRYLDAAREGMLYAALNLREGRETLLRDHLRHPQAVGAMRLARRPLGPNVRFARTALRLAHLEGSTPDRSEVRAMLERLAPQLETIGPFGAELALAIEELERAPVHVRILGKPGANRDALQLAAANAPTIWSVIEQGAAEGRPRAEVTLDGETRALVAVPALLAAMAGSR